MKNNKKDKVRRNNKRKVLIIVLILILLLVVTIVLITNSLYVKKKILENKLSNMAEKYYTEEFIKVAKSYMKDKGKISINLETLRNYGDDTSIYVNPETKQKCSDVGTYVTIVIDKNKVNDWTKDYKVEKVVLDCFEK